MIFKRTIKLPPLFLLLFLFILSNHTFAIVTCSDPVEECIEGKDEVRYIDNVPVSPGCWKYRVTYECRETSDNNCQLLREAGCSQLSASCKTMLNGSCVVQDEVYNCPVKKCEQVNNIQCAKSDKKGIFCKDGACAETDDQKNNNFEQSAASLAALEATNSRL